MQAKTIISVAATVASFGAAFAGTPAKVVAPTPAPQVASSCPLSGSVFAGYETNYTCRGIVASQILAEGDSVIPAGVNLNYKLNDANSIVASATYTTLTSGHHLYTSKSNISFSNETDFKLGWQNKGGLLNNLSTTFGYNLIYGGLLGNLAKYDYSNCEYSNCEHRNAHSITQELFLNLNYDITDNLFAGLTTSYAFQGMTGWWFQPYVGYKASLCSAADVVLTAGMSATAGYFDSKSAVFANGAQAWWVKAEVPVKLGLDDLVLVPFVSFNWAGTGTLKANKRFVEGEKPFKNFGVVAGAKLVYSF